MAKFLVLYRDDQPEEESQWEKWNGEVSNSMVDAGRCQSPAMLITPDEARQLDGNHVVAFRKIEATDFEEAVELARSYPLGRGRVAELVQVS